MSQHSSSRKRDRLLNLVRTRDKPTNPTSSAPHNPAAPCQATPSPVLLALQKPVVQQPAQTILEKALSGLETREREIIEAHRAVGSHEIQVVVQDAYTAALARKQECDDERWQWTFRGRTVSLRDEAGKVMAWIDRFKSVGDLVANIDPVHIGLPWAGIRMILEVYKQGFHGGIADLLQPQITTSNSNYMAALLTGMSMALQMANRLHVYVLFFQRLSPTLARDNFERALITTYVETLRFLATAIDSYKKNTATRMWQALWQTSTLEKFESLSDELGSRLEIEASNCDREDAQQWKSDLQQALRQLDDIQRIGNAVDDLQVSVDLTKLMTAKAAVYNAYADGDDTIWCLQGTRTQLLDQIIEWTNEPGGKSIFWLRGMAGTGKSTIARTVSKILDKQRRLGASFFFKRGERDRSNASLFFPTIARQLADLEPGLKMPIAHALEADSQLCERNLQEQFEKLVFKPLLDVVPGRGTPTIVIVVDALDECERSSDIRAILVLLAKLQSVGSLHLRFFVTSRPELPIQLGFQTMSGDLHQDIKLEEVQVNTIKHDLDTYFRHRLGEIRGEEDGIHPDDPLPRDWPGEHHVKALVDLASPLFIAASTICRYVSERDPQTRMQAMLQHSEQTGQMPLTGLDKIYIPILDHIIQDCDAESRCQAVEDFRGLVGPIILLADPLSVSALGDLLAIPRRTIVDRLKHLHSVLSIPADHDSPVRLLHLSFRDVLVNPRMRNESQFWIDEIQVHRRVAADCLRRLNTTGTLKQDVCGVVEPGTRRGDVSKAQIARFLPPDVAYACCYWVWHLLRAKESLHDGDCVHQFLRQYFLYWLEALSWLGRLSDAVKYISDLQQLVRKDTGVELLAFLKDATRFLLRNRYVIDLAPLQAYYSALVFTPEQSIVRRQFEHCRPRQLIQSPDVPLAWSPEILRLESSADWVTAVAFSPDGQVLATTPEYANGTVRLWNATTGEEKQRLRLVGYPRYHKINTLAFSPDGQAVALGFADGTVRLCNAVTGEEMQRVWLVGYPPRYSTNTLAFSPDGQVVALWSNDETVLLWNAATGELTQQLQLKAHTNWVADVAVSSDRQVVASTSGIVQLWNAATGEETQQLRAHAAAVTVVAFSLDGQAVALGYADGAVWLWNTATGEETRQLGAHADMVLAVAFSPDGQVVASGSYDGTVRLWNAAAGEEAQQLRAHAADVTAVAFSLDGQAVALGYTDGAVWLWNTATGEETRQLGAHADTVLAVAFSPDGQVVASGSYDRTVRLWNVATGEELHQFQHNAFVKSLVFDDHGTVLVTDSSTFDVRQYLSSSNDFAATRNRPLMELREQWVRCRGKDFLWLPYEYRGWCSAVSGNKLVIGQGSGAVSFFTVLDN